MGAMRRKIYWTRIRMLGCCSGYTIPKHQEKKTLSTKSALVSFIVGCSSFPRLINEKNGNVWERGEREPEGEGGKLSTNCSQYQYKPGGHLKLVTFVVVSILLLSSIRFFRLPHNLCPSSSLTLVKFFIFPVFPFFEV